MTNKEKLEQLAGEHEIELGIYHKKIDTLSTRSLNKLMREIDFYSDGDIKVTNNIIIEVFFVDREIDLLYYTKNEYINKYGNNGSHVLD